MVLELDRGYSLTIASFWIFLLLLKFLGSFFLFLFSGTFFLGNQDLSLGRMLKIFFMGRRARRFPVKIFFLAIPPRIHLGWLILWRIFLKIPRNFIGVFLFLRNFF